MAGFQWLAQHFQNVAVELRQFVEEQHAVVRQLDFAGPDMTGGSYWLWERSPDREYRVGQAASRPGGRSHNPRSGFQAPGEIARYMAATALVFIVPGLGRLLTRLGGYRGRILPGAALRLVQRVGGLVSEPELTQISALLAERVGLIRTIHGPRPSGVIAALDVQFGSPAELSNQRRFAPPGFSSDTRQQKAKTPHAGRFCFLAERVGFEPTVRKTVHLISSQAHSTTLAPLRLCALFARLSYSEQS